MALLNKDLYEYLRTKNLSIAKNTVVKTTLFNFVKSMKHVEVSDLDNLRQKVNMFVVHLHEKWQRANRKDDQFLKNNKGWLQLEFMISSKKTRDTSKNLETRSTNCEVGL